MLYDLLALAMPLLAEGSVDPLTIAGGIAAGGGGGVGITLALLKWRQQKSEEKDKEQDTEVKNLNATLTNLQQTIIKQGGEIKTDIHESEKRTDQKLSDLTRTISRKIEGIKEVQSEHGTKLALLENEAAHTKDRLDSHARKITLYGKTGVGGTGTGT